jgi:hypothetical protein
MGHEFLAVRRVERTILYIFTILLTTALCFAQDVPRNEAVEPAILEDSRQEDESLPEPIVQELFLSEVPISQEKGEVQTTISPRLAPWREDRFFQTSFVTEYGITDRLQVDAEVPFTRVSVPGEPVDKGFEEVEFGALYALGRNVDHLLVTAAVRMGVLNSSEEIPNAPSVQVEPSLMFGKRLGPIQAHWGVSTTLVGERSVGLAAAAVYPWSRWRGSLEVVTSSGEERETHLAPGLIYEFSGLEFGVATPVQLQGSGPPITLMFVATHEFGGKRE